MQWPQTAIVSGDALSYSIAAASILAKVSRDRLMIQLDSQYPGYGFASHKGYGTPDHVAAIKERGPCADSSPVFFALSTWSRWICLNPLDELAGTIQMVGRQKGSAADRAPRPIGRTGGKEASAKTAG